MDKKIKNTMPAITVHPEWDPFPHIW
jgi:hypothetical protein